MILAESISRPRGWPSAIGSVLLALSAAGCGPTEAPAPPSGTPASAPAEATAKTKGGAPKRDTTSRRELQKQRAAERAKSGQPE
jgi:hypothetical protein